jgi:hypothetical protein
MTIILGNMVVKPSKNKRSRGKSRQTDPIQAAIDYGIDISMLIDNLKRTPTERIRRHQAALETIEKLRKAKRL